MRTLAAALLSKSFSLGELSKHLQCESQNLETEEHGGPLSEDCLNYALRDVQTTWECFVARDLTGFSEPDDMSIELDGERRC